MISYPVNRVLVSWGCLAPGMASEPVCLSVCLTVWRWFPGLSGGLGVLEGRLIWRSVGNQGGPVDTLALGTWTSLSSYHWRDCDSDV